MERLHHPNVIRLYEVIETLAKLHIIMEYATGGELFTKISNEGRLTEKEARPLFAQIIAAVEHMVSAVMTSVFYSVVSDGHWTKPLHESTAQIHCTNPLHKSTA